MYNMSIISKLNIIKNCFKTRNALNRKKLVFMFYGEAYAFFDINLLETLNFFSNKGQEFEISVFDRENKYIDVNFAKEVGIKLYDNLGDDFFSNCNEADYIFCSTYQYIIQALDKINNDKIKIINVWHGLPVRNINALNKFEAEYCKEVLYHKKKEQVHHIVSSKFYQEIFALSFLAPMKNVHIFGNIRRDVICNKNFMALEFIKTIAKDCNYNKIIIFCPTQAIVLGQTVLPWEGYDITSFNNFLKQEKILFLYKPHDAKGIVDMPEMENIKQIQTLDLINNKLFTQYLFAYSDILITNASSVFTDFLLLNRPIIFIDLPEEYKERGGFVSEDFFKAGEVIKTQEELVASILRELKEDTFKKQRRNSIKLVYDYQDSKTLNRLYNFIS